MRDDLDRATTTQHESTWIPRAQPSKGHDMPVTAPTRPKAGPALLAAEEALRDELNQFDRIIEPTEQQWHERDLISALLGVVDHARRIYQADSAHYRCEKSGTLLREAINVQRAAFRRYEDSGEVDLAHTVTTDVVNAIRVVLFGLTRGALEETDVRQLRALGLAGLADMVEPRIAQ
jgi:hypothetical protein